MAATARKLELNALLNPIQKTVSGLTSAARNMPSISMSQPTNLSSTLFQFSVALFIIFAVLLVIHYAITPIFQFRPGDGGLIPLGANGGGQLQWTAAPPLSDLSANIIRQLPSEFTIQQDICIQNPTILSDRKRVFSYRANTPIVVNANQPENLLTQYPDSNLFMYLSPTTNDLIVTAVTKKPNNDLVFESVPTMLNVPTNEVFRLTVVLLPQMMEVYLNGKLYGTRTFTYTLLTTNTYFFPTPDAFRNSVRVMNFKYWDRGLSSVEIKNSTPPLPPKELFFPKDTATAQCS
jgi:hypothetical protein